MPTQREIKDQILELVEERGSEKTICPSEAARALDAKQWRSLMNDVREAASVLKHEGKIAIEQNGKPVSIAKSNGPIRLRFRQE